MSGPFGFKFWLGWILGFALSFVVVAGAWTVALTALFGAIRGPELTFTWAVCVFGSWFILLIPFMRKKERIWKRLNQDQEAALSAWLGAMGLFVGLLMASSVGWSFYFLRILRAPLEKQGFDTGWGRAVLISWLLLILPFLVWMYRKADSLFKRAAERQAGLLRPRFQTQFVERSRRILPAPLEARLASIPPLLEGGHVVNVFLKDGREVPHVFIFQRKEILGVYDRPELGFTASDIADLSPLSKDNLPLYEEAKWLRLDGRA